MSSPRYRLFAQVPLHTQAEVDWWWNNSKMPKESRSYVDIRIGVAAVTIQLHREQFAEDVENIIRNFLQVAHRTDAVRVVWSTQPKKQHIAAPDEIGGGISLISAQSSWRATTWQEEDNELARRESEKKNVPSTPADD